MKIIKLETNCSQEFISTAYKQNIQLYAQKKLDYEVEMKEPYMEIQNTELHSKFNEQQLLPMFCTAILYSLHYENYLLPENNIRKRVKEYIYFVNIKIKILDKYDQEKHFHFE